MHSMQPNNESFLIQVQIYKHQDRLLNRYIRYSILFANIKFAENIKRQKIKCIITGKWVIRTRNLVQSLLKLLGTKKSCNKHKLKYIQTMPLPPPAVLQIYSTCSWMVVRISHQYHQSFVTLTDRRTKWDRHHTRPKTWASGKNIKGFMREPHICKKLEYVANIWDKNVSYIAKLRRSKITPDESNHKSWLEDSWWECNSFLNCTSLQNHSLQATHTITSHLTPQPS